MQISIISTIYLTAFVQALILIFVIGRKEKILHSEKYLIGILIALSITLVQYVGIINQLIPLSSIYMHISAIAWQTISPLLFLYCRSLVGQEYRWTNKNLIYFPFSLFFILQSLLILLGSSIPIHKLFSTVNAYNTAWIMVYLINSLVFSIASIRILVAASISEKHKQKLNWLVRYFQLFSTCLSGLTILLLWWLSADYFFQQFEFILLLFYALFIFTLVAMSLRFSHYFSMISNDHYGHDQRDDLELVALSKQLIVYMEQEKPYLSPKVTLTDLARSTEMTENQLSQIFTRHFKSSFYKFINEYRLREFDNQLREKGTEQYTIMALAESAGFASKATFYKVFKIHHQMTPTEYIKQIT